MFRQGPQKYQQFQDEQRVISNKQEFPQEVQAGVLGGKEGNSDFPSDQIPPDFNLAELHREAWNVGTTKLSKSQLRSLRLHQNTPNISEEEKLVGQICKCCARQVPKDRVKIDCNNQDYSFLGAGMPLYFEYIKACILMLIVMFVTSGDYNIITNIAFGQSCQSLDKSIGFEIDEKAVCIFNWVTGLSLANKREDQEFIDLQQMLNLISMLTLIILFQYFRKEQRAFDTEIDSNTYYASDYTILLKNIPTHTEGLKNDDFDQDLKDYLEVYIERTYEKPIEVLDYEEELRQFLQRNNRPEKKLSRVVAVNLCYNIEEQTILEQEKQSKIAQKQKLLPSLYDQGLLPGSEDINNNEQIKEIDNQIIEIEQKLEALEKRFVEGKDVKQYFLGQAFVTFRWESDVQWMLIDHRLSLCSRILGRKSNLIYRGSQLQVEQPPEPTDVFWENLHIQTSQKIWRRILGYFLTFIILGVCGGLIYWLSAIQAQSADEQAKAVKNGDLNPNYKVKVIAQLASISIIIINYILSIVIRKVSLFERFSTQTGFNISLASKSSLAQFVNTAVITFAISTWVTKNIYGTGGLVYNQTYVFISNAILPALIQLIDSSTIMKWLYQFFELRKGKASVKTQKQLHDLFERPVFDISTSYATVLKNMYVVAFYASVIPIGLVITCFALLFFYWVEKYNIARRRTIKYNYSSVMSREMIEQLEYVLPIYCLTNLWWEYVFLQSISIEAIIGVCFGVANAILPMHEINKLLFRMKAKPNEHLPINEAEVGFLTDYCRENPATAETERARYQERVTRHQKDKIAMDQMFEQ
ncbi:unnamed protein product [Paramecium primaurelia]|uniref:CSC1/OSCA1-like cytosolic domain-containing protein n=1 Tax=Paramecium primaurelia TaxID=5886 RepID=A0A8S1NQC7_PARPR|nr:unnamed protein product [Paramecium primaurelia]